MNGNPVQEISLVSVIHGIFKLVKKHFKILLVINAIILIGGISWRLTRDLAYEGTVIVKSNFIEYHFIDGIISPLNRHISEMHSEILAKSLNVSPEMAGSLGNISIKSLIDEEYVEKRKIKNLDDLDEYEMDIIFELSVSSSKPALIPELKDAVINYLSNQEYIKQRAEFYEKERKEVSMLLSKDIATMDSIKMALASLHKTKGSYPSGVIIQDLGDFYFASSRIYEMYVDYNYQNKFKEPFEELSNLEIFGKYVYPRWTFVLLVTLAVMIGATTISIIGLESIELFRKTEV